MVREIEVGFVCPLEKFKVDVAGGCGGYTRDPVEACFDCNFSDVSQEGFDLERICKCPREISWGEYEKLRGEYASKSGKLTKPGFQDFVRKTYVKIADAKNHASQELGS